MHCISKVLIPLELFFHISSIYFVISVIIIDLMVTLFTYHHGNKVKLKSSSVLIFATVILSKKEVLLVELLMR